MVKNYLIIPFLALLHLNAHGEMAYSISPLLTPSGTTYAQARGISPGGIVVGDAFVGDYDSQKGYYQPVLWQNGISTLLPISSGMSGAAGGVNDSGAVSGGVWSGAIPNPALPGTPGEWKAGQFQGFSAPSGYSGSTSAINAAGEVVGGVESRVDHLPTGVAAGYAVKWIGGLPTKIGDFPNTWSDAVAINGTGQILLNVGDGTYTETFVWSNGNLAKVPAITGNVAAGNAMNDSGQAVGGSLSGDGTVHGFLWENGTTLDLGKASGDTSSVAVGINDTGLIIGYGYDSNGQFDGLFWENGQLYNLLSLISDHSGWTSLQPAGFADDGSIAGTGVYKGQTVAFLMTPAAASSASVLEPEMLGSLVAGGVMMMLRRRRGARSKW